MTQPEALLDAAQRLLDDGLDYPRAGEDSQTLARAVLQAQGALQAAPEPPLRSDIQWTVRNAPGSITRHPRATPESVSGAAPEPTTIALMNDSERWIYRQGYNDGLAAGAAPQAAIGATPEPDAERYRWLRDQHTWDGEGDSDRGMTRWWVSAGRDPVPCDPGALDAEIDAARGATLAGPASIGVPSLLSVGEKS